MSEGSSRSSNFWFGFVLGGAVGGLLTLLFTTKKGEEIREKISEEGEGWLGQVIGALGKVIDELEEKTEEVKEEAGEKLGKKFKKPLAEIQALKKEIEVAKKPTGKPRRFFKKRSKKI